MVIMILLKICSTVNTCRWAMPFYQKSSLEIGSVAYLKEHLKRALGWLLPYLSYSSLGLQIFFLHLGKSDRLKLLKKMQISNIKKLFSHCWHFQTTVNVKSVQTRAKNVMYYALVLKFKEERLTLFCNNCLSKDP